MSSLPRVSALTREKVSREFDARGPDVCQAEITLDLKTNNPELLEIAARCARDVGDTDRVMTRFCMFYRLLTAEARAALSSLPAVDERLRLSLLPKVSEQTRTGIVKRIDALGSAQFTREALAELERDNPELLVMAHGFAEEQRDYLGVMQGFALLYACLSAEAAQHRSSLH
jgi:hypothetical protein